MLKKTGVVHQLRWLFGQTLILDDQIGGEQESIGNDITVWEVWR